MTKINNGRYSFCPWTDYAGVSSVEKNGKDLSTTTQIDTSHSTKFSSTGEVNEHIQLLIHVLSVLKDIIKKALKENILTST